MEYPCWRDTSSGEDKDRDPSILVGCSGDADHLVVAEGVDPMPAVGDPIVDNELHHRLGNVALETAHTSH